jgi:chemotaxis response regulator CheB
VLLADANASFVEAVKSTLARQPGIRLVGCALDRDQALELAFSEAPDIAFIAVDMPGGVDAAHTMLRTMPRPPKIILLSAEQVEAGPGSGPDVSLHGFGLDGVKGFSGYLNKTDDAAEMIALLAALTSLSTEPPPSTNGAH